MKVIFSTNIPSPYRVDFFNELGKYCDLTVVFERRSSAERDAKWKGADAVNFKDVFLDLEDYGVDVAKGGALKDYIKKHNSDFLFFTNYSSPATREAITWCRLHGRKYYMEYDGGFNKKDHFIKRMYKKFLLRGAVAHLTTADEHINYLRSLGIKETKIFKYPFTSIRQNDLEIATTLLSKEKQYFRDKLGIMEQQVILTVGRFSHGGAHIKGYDVLLNCAQSLRDIGIYIVGEEPTENFVDLKKKFQLEHVHFVGFKTKDELIEYYAAADLFILLTRGDIWGLVVNEAMSYSLPVITTNRCIAGLELVQNDINGYIVDYTDTELIYNKINVILGNSSLAKSMSENSFKKVKDYTIEKMCSRHIEIMESLTEDKTL